MTVAGFGFVLCERAGGKLLCSLLAERYSQRATVITSQCAFGQWVKACDDEKLTIVLLDWLGHRSHLLTIIRHSAYLLVSFTNRGFHQPYP
jgi:IstB-like ATP binding protein